MTLCTMTLRATTPYIMEQSTPSITIISITTPSIMTFRATTPGTMTLRIMTLVITIKMPVIIMCRIIIKCDKA